MTRRVASMSALQALELSPSLGEAAAKLGLSPATLRRLAADRPSLRGPYALCRLRGLSWDTRRAVSA